MYMSHHDVHMHVHIHVHVVVHGVHMYVPVLSDVFSFCVSVQPLQLIFILCL